jgi:hypothetical protein
MTELREREQRILHFAFIRHEPHRKGRLQFFAAAGTCLANHSVTAIGHTDMPNALCFGTKTGHKTGPPTILLLRAFVVPGRSTSTPSRCLATTCGETHRLTVGVSFKSCQTGHGLVACRLEIHLLGRQRGFTVARVVLGVSGLALPVTLWNLLAMCPPAIG